MTRLANQLTIWASLLLAVLGAGCHGNESPPTGEKSTESHVKEHKPAKKRTPKPLTVATYNVHYANSKYDALSQMLRESRADVIALQETSPILERYLKIRLGRDYPHQFYTGFRDQFLGERFGLLSKVPLRSVRFHPPRHGLFGFLTAEFPWDGRVVKLINVHFEPFEASADWSLFRQLAAIEKIHQEEILEALKQRDPNQPTLIVGDFNSPSDFVAPSEIRKHGFQDSFAHRFKTLAEADEHNTWRWGLGEKKLELRIDYIFHDAHWTTRESRLGEFDDSDHRMLMSTFELAAGPPLANRDP